MMVIRAMSKAKYSSKNIGHFGLMFENYTHFTSPIRRYPDLIVHRLINDIINKKNITINDLESLCLHCSTMEERATKACFHLNHFFLTKKNISNKYVSIRKRKIE